MGDPFAIAVVALGLSLGVSAIRLIDWFIHSEPKAVVRMARWAGMVLAVLSVPLLLVLLILRQWTTAVGLGWPRSARTSGGAVRRQRGVRRGRRPIGVPPTRSLRRS